MEEYGSQSDYGQHLRVIHGFSSDTVRCHLNLIAEANLKAPPRTSAKFLDTQCLYPGCKSATSFLDYEGYITHLRRIHRLSSNQFPEHMPTAITANPVVISATHCAGPPFHHDLQEPDSYMQHLRGPHGVLRTDYGFYMSGDIIGTVNVTQCRYPGCKSRLFYQTNDQYNGHSS
ncbi:hypothetical protein LTR74_007178 [Friedmanniomyces endolithicus]|nr:hypothetical protein LTR74_007178 [Friedmanniomyces endolithicus]